MVDAPDVTFLSRRSDLAGDYHFQGLSEGYPYYSSGNMLSLGVHLALRQLYRTMERTCIMPEQGHASALTY